MDLPVLSRSCHNGASHKYRCMKVDNRAKRIVFEMQADWAPWCYIIAVWYCRSASLVWSITGFGLGSGKLHLKGFSTHTHHCTLWWWRWLVSICSHECSHYNGGRHFWLQFYSGEIVLVSCDVAVVVVVGSGSGYTRHRWRLHGLELLYELRRPAMGTLC